MNKRFRFFRVTVPAAIAFLSVSAHAEVPAAVTAAITDGGVDAATVAAALLVAWFGFKLFKWMRGT